MVKTRSEVQTQWPLPRVRIKTSDLSEIIKKCAEGSETVTAVNGLHEFESLEDICRNNELLAGGPTVTIDCTEITLHTWRSGVRFLSNIQDADIAKTHAIMERLKLLLTPHRTYIRGPAFRWFFSLAIGIAVMLIADRYNFETWQAISFGVAACLCAFLVTDKFLADQSVFYTPIETFWDRNKDRVIVGIVMALVGAGVTLTVQTYITPPQLVIPNSDVPAQTPQPLAE